MPRFHIRFSGAERGFAPVILGPFTGMRLVSADLQCQRDEAEWLPVARLDQDWGEWDLVAQTGSYNQIELIPTTGSATP